MKNKAVSSSWRFGWLLLGIAFLAMYTFLYWGFIDYWHDWYGGWVYMMPKIPLNPDTISWYILSLSQLFATTSAFLLGVLGCVLVILQIWERKPRLYHAKWIGSLLGIYLGSVLFVVGSELMDPSFGLFRWFCLWVPTSFVLYLLPFWVYYSESRYPKRYPTVAISFAHIGLATIPFGLLIFFAFSTYWNMVDVIQ